MSISAKDTQTQSSIKSKFNDEFAENKHVARADIFSKHIDWWRD